MWTSTLDLDPAHVLPAKLLGLVWSGAYFSSFAPLQVQNLPRQPLPAENWVRVRNSLAGICGSDLHLIFLDGDLRVAPAALPGQSRSYPGHEVVGEVIQVGEEVESLHAGDRVVLRHGPNCVSAGVQPPCRSCAAGNYVLCENGSLPGPQPVGGGWSEEMLLHEQQLFAIPPSISDSQAVLLEPSAVALHAVLRRLPSAGERVLIIGAGTIGLLTLQVLRALAPAAQVHVMARHAFQVERAATMGAKIIYPRNSYQQISRLTSARLYSGVAGNKMLLGGYDVIFDTIGSGRTTNDALRWTRAGGTVVMVGVNLHHMRLDLTPVWYQEINLIGTMGQGMETWPPQTDGRRSTFEIAAELIAHEQIHPQELITQRYTLSEYRVALLEAKKKAHNRAIKVVFDFSLQPASVVPNVRAAARQPRIPAGGETRPATSESARSLPAPSAWAPETPLPVAYEPEEATEKVVAATTQQRYFTSSTAEDSLVEAASSAQEQDRPEQFDPPPLVTTPARADAGQLAEEETMAPLAAPLALGEDVMEASDPAPPAPPPLMDDHAQEAAAALAGERSCDTPVLAEDRPEYDAEPPPPAEAAAALEAVEPPDAAPAVKRTRSRRKTTDLGSIGRRAANGEQRK
jgi:threonine dehydrogenase-like Zn-dependent dehydrogenase